MSQDDELAVTGVPVECGEDIVEWEVGSDRTAEKNDQGARHC